MYLDLTHIPIAELNWKLGGILEIYEKFQGVDPRVNPMNIFPAVHYTMGGLWADYQRTAAGGLEVGSPRNQVTSIPNLYAIGECDYQYHGGNRLGANSLLSCIFTGLFTAPGLVNLLNAQQGAVSEMEPAMFESERRRHEEIHRDLLKRNIGGENSYFIHQQLGDAMTKAATVVRRNQQLEDAYQTVSELHERSANCALSDTGSWTNQNVVFTKALQDMFPIAKSILKGALQRDECRGAHFKPDFAMPSLDSMDPADRKAEAEAWCDRFNANNQKWLKSTVVSWNGTDPDIQYQDVDTSLIEPRPHLYALVGAEVIMDVWTSRQAEKGNGSAGETAEATTVGS